MQRQTAHVCKVEANLTSGIMLVAVFKKACWFGICDTTVAFESITNFLEGLRHFLALFARFVFVSRQPLPREIIFHFPVALAQFWRIVRLVDEGPSSFSIANPIPVRALFD